MEAQGLFGEIIDDRDELSSNRYFNEGFNKNNIVLKSKVNQDEYTDYVKEAFDLRVDDMAVVDIPNNLHLDKIEKWNIGVICGASGSGKSTILKSIGEVRDCVFDDKKPLISNFDNMTPKDASSLLCSMGLASVPTWIRPFNTLSNGEKYRAELAKKVSMGGADDIILVDEYTSVVDRNVAKSMSNALQKYIRRENKRIILATCHYDIFDWLQPDWIYDLNKGGTLERGDCLRQRPQIQLQIHRTTSDTWRLFKKHHYMTNELNKSSQCFVFTWNNQIVGFCFVLPLFGKGIVNAVRFHRIVVLPDFQGLGIGSAIVDNIAAIYKSIGKTMYIKTINPRLGFYLTKSDKWMLTPHSGKYRKDIEKNDALRCKSHLSRASYCAKYVGKEIYGYENLIQPIDKMRYDLAMEGQLTLF